MATNFVQRGDVITVAAPSGGVLSGDPVAIGFIFGVATHDAEETLPLELAMTGVFTLPADTNLVISAGDRLYWDAANGWLDKTSTSQVAVAVAVEAKVLAGASVVCRLGASVPAGI